MGITSPHTAIMGKRSADLLYPTHEEESRKHKLKRLVQSQTHSSWMSSALAASTSHRSSAMLKLLCSARLAPLLCVNLPVGVAALPRAALTARRRMPKRREKHSTNAN